RLLIWTVFAMLDRLFFISLLLNATGLFRFIAPQLGVSIGMVSIAFLLFHIVYIFCRAETLSRVFRRSGLIIWTVVLLLWPLATIVYAPSIEIRQAGLQFYYYSLFLGTIVFVHRNGLRSVYRLLWLSVIITVFGMALSKLAPGYFYDVAALANARVPGKATMGRPTGFYMQPNSLAISLVMMFVGWFGLWPQKSVAKEVIVLIGFLGLQVLTGSRAGILVAVGIIGLYLMHNWAVRLTRGRLVFTLGLLLLALAIGVAGMRLYVRVAAANAEFRKSGDLIDRMEKIVYFELSPDGNIVEDTSLRERFDTQADFLEYIMERPVIGHGFGSNVYYLETGRLWLSAHSHALTGAFEYGVFYPLVLCCLVASMFFSRNRPFVEKHLGSNIIFQFVAVFIILYAYAGLLDNRVVFIILGLVYSLVHYPELLFHLEHRPAAEPGSAASGVSIEHACPAEGV
ncbi:MAG: O-antigen ligase family protein, partial [Candidatus Sumerlaeota bacterium]